MRRTARTGALLALLLLCPAAPLAAGDEAPSALPFTEDEAAKIDRALRLETELVRLVEKIRPCSVTIENWQGGGKNRPPRMASGGSGVIISRKGHILTNQHVVRGAQEIWIVLEDGRRAKAELVGNDPRGDVALIRIDERRIRFVDPGRGDPGRLSAGEWVIATGNPFFLASDGQPVVTLGVVSGLGRVLGGEFMYGDAIQHDAEINPGNSGGPLWDTNGNLIGINGRIASSGAGSLAGASSTGVGFTIPIDQIRNFFEAMMEGRPALHGDELLGLKVETATDDTGMPIGARVTEVAEGSPATTARAGSIEKGDVIWRLTISGRPNEVETSRDFMRFMSPLAEGSKVTVHVLRGPKQIVFPNLELVRPKKAGRGK